MNGHYVDKQFDLNVVKALVAELESSELPIEVEWVDGLKKTDEVMGVHVNAYGKLLFSQFKSGGAVNTGMLKPEEEAVFFSILKKYAANHEPPSAAKAFGFFALYCIIEFLAHWSLLGDSGVPSWLLTLSIFGAISTVVIVLFHDLVPEPDDSKWRSSWGLLLLAPGYILTLPAAILTMNMLGHGARQRLCDRLDAV